MTLLAGLQGSQPFGFAGQYYDASAGTYDMRAREYSPEQGQFESQDPHAYDPQVPVTIDPYEYAGQMPTDVSDPSGQDWVFPSGGLGDPTGHYQDESAIAGQAQGIRTLLGSGLGAAPGQLEQALAGLTRAGQASTGSPTEIANTQYWVPVLQKTPACLQISRAADLSLNRTNSYSANIVDLSRHMLWDIEPASAAVATTRTRP